MKLGFQFRGGAEGGERVSDSVGAGSEAFGLDGRKENGGWENGAPGLRESGWQDVGEMLRGRGRKGGKRNNKGEGSSGNGNGKLVSEKTSDNADDQAAKKPRQRKIFDGVCIYINGSTAPAVSDHKLKHMLAEHGATLNIALGRRTVTHVILGSPNGGGGVVGKGAGGGLAAGKIQKEIRQVRGCAVQFVGVDW